MDTTQTAEKRAPDAGRTRKYVWFHQAMQAISYVAAPATLIGVLRDWKSTIDFIVNNLTTAIVFLALLAALFVGFLLHSINFRLPRITFSMPKIAWKKSVKVTGIILAVLALGVVLFTIYTVYVSGIYYIILESSTNETAVVRRVNDLNEMLEAAGIDEVRVEVQEPIGRSEYYAITAGGPFLSRARAESTFVTIKNLLGSQVRKDAGIRQVTVRNIVGKYTGQHG